jgi:hypothetical protein
VCSSTIGGFGKSQGKEAICFVNAYGVSRHSRDIDGFEETQGRVVCEALDKQILCGLFKVLF